MLRFGEWLLALTPYVWLSLVVVGVVTAVISHATIRWANGVHASLGETTDHAEQRRQVRRAMATAGVSLLLVASILFLVVSLWQAVAWTDETVPVLGPLWEPSVALGMALALGTAYRRAAGQRYRLAVTGVFAVVFALMPRGLLLSIAVYEVVRAVLNKLVPLASADLDAN